MSDHDDDDGRRDDDEVAPTVLGDVISSTLDRMHDRESETPPTHNPLQAIVGSVLTRLATAQRHQQEEAAADDAAPDTASPQAAPRPPAPVAFDVQALVDEAVRAFVRTRLSDSPGQGAARVVVDGEYVARHGSELVPAILAHIAQAWIAVLGGTSPPAPPQASAEVDIEIEYDFSDIVRAALARNRES